MELAKDIYRNVFRGVWHNFGALLKMFAPTLIVFSLLAGILVGLFFWLSTGLGIFVAVLAAFAYCCLIGGLSVKFHRYFLKDEREIGWVPFQLNWRKGLGYFGYSILLYLILFGIAIVPIYLSYMIIGTGLYYNSGTALIVIVAIAMVFFGWFMAWVFLRFGMVLPAYAVDKPIGLGEAWNKTKPNSKVFWAVAFFYCLTVLVFNLFSALEYILPANGFVLAVYYILFILASIYYIFVILGIFTESYRRLIAESSES